MELSKGGSFEKKLFTGFTTGNVIAINPTKEELAEMYGYELKSDAKDQVYEGKTQDQNDYVDIIFYIQSHDPSKTIFNVRYRLINKPVISSNGDKKQFVNQNGEHAWVDSEENLKSWFTTYEDFKTKQLITSDNEGSLTGKRKVRVAIQGEADLYNFVKAWLGGANFKSERTNIFVDIDKLFRDPDTYIEKTYRSQIKAGDEGYARNIAFMTYVGMSEKDGQTKMFQNVYKDIISAYNYKKFSFAITTNDWTKDKIVSKWYEQVTGKYGCNGAYTLTPIQPFDSATHQQVTTEVVKAADDIDF